MNLLVFMEVVDEAQQSKRVLRVGLLCLHLLKQLGLELDKNNETSKRDVSLKL